MSSPPGRGWTKLQAAVLREVKEFDTKELRPSPTLVKTLLGTSVECRSRESACEMDERLRAIQKVKAARARVSKDKYPCKVAEGLYIGPVGAARNLKQLQKCGITHILNASPAVPCFFREHGSFAYHTVDLFDDPEADLLSHLEAANAFIGEGRAAGGVLVHCYAGQSRSAALVMAYLMAAEGRDMVAAWGLVRRARPQAKPNSGFLRQLAQYASELGREGAFEIA